MDNIWLEFVYVANQVSSSGRRVATLVAQETRSQIVKVVLDLSAEFKTISVCGCPLPVCDEALMSVLNKPRRQLGRPPASTSKSAHAVYL